MDFVRSGLVDLNNGSLRHFGLDGRIWSRSTASDSVDSFGTMYLNFTPSVVNTSHGPLVGWVGISVRCLVY